MGSLVESMNDIYTNEILIILLSLYGVFIIIYLPFCCYCSYKLYASRDEPYVKIRKAILSHSIVILCVLFVLNRLILSDIYCAIFNKCLSHNYHISSFLSPPSNDQETTNEDIEDKLNVIVILSNINAFFNMLWLICCLPKIFWVYYELSLQNALSNEKWWIQFNDKLGENIFIKYHNNIYMYSIVALLLYIIIAISICYFFNTFGQFVIYAITSLIIIISTLFMIYHLPKIDDIFYLRQELKYCIIIYLPLIIFFNISNVFIYNPSQIWHIIDCMIFMISTAILIYIVTIQPINILFSAKTSSKLQLAYKSDSNRATILSSIHSASHPPANDNNNSSKSTPTLPHQLTVQSQHSRSNSTTNPSNQMSSVPNSRQNSPKHNGFDGVNVNVNIRCDILENEIELEPTQYTLPKDSFCGPIDETKEVSINMEIKEDLDSPSPDHAIPKTWSEWIEKSTDNFNRFMQTLTAELAVENLLFILEVTQFKRKIIKKIVRIHEGGRKSPVSMSRNASSKDDRGFPNIISITNSRSVSKTEQSISNQTIDKFSTKTGWFFSVF